ncbi:hypothetical protein [Nocardiopsis synnemataformans]|uniref:hypothetical protein n=1 Tax=Nocardiopsis synnemataformans TaxID=61305 RepID=UPI003EBE02E8
MDFTRLADVGSTFLDDKGGTWYATYHQGALALVSPGAITFRSRTEVETEAGPLLRSSFTSAELDTIVAALTSFGTGSTAQIRPRVQALADRVRLIEAQGQSPM